MKAVRQYCGFLWKSRLLTAYCAVSLPGLPPFTVAIEDIHDLSFGK